MALKCGHRTVDKDGEPLSEEVKLDMLILGHVCPACKTGVKMDQLWQHTIRKQYHCACCEEIWTTTRDGKKVAFVMYGSGEL